VTALRTPDPGVDRAFALAAAQAEALVRREEGITDAERSRLASALLGAGIRSPARDLLRRSAERSAGAGTVGALARAYRAWAVDESGPDETPSLAPSDPPTDIREAAGELARDPEAPRAVARMLEAALTGLWGVAPDAQAGAVSIHPELPAEWPSMALTRLRIGRTVLDLDLRRLRAGLGMRIRRVTGPALVATVEPRPPMPGPTVVDDVELPGSRVRFEVTGRHDLVFHGPVR
jgi:hypothetical protein